jgi:hypothetical protein
LTKESNASFGDRIGDLVPKEFADPVGPDFSPAWRTVSFGTGCMSVGAICLFAGTMILPILTVPNAQLRGDRFAVADHRGATLFLTEYLILACVLVVLFGAMLWLAGLCLGCLAPAESGARPMAAAAMVLWLAFLVAMLPTTLAPLFGVHPHEPRFVGERPDPRMAFVNETGLRAAGGTLGLGSFICTIGFVCAVAHHFKNQALARSAQRVVLYQIGAVGASLLIGIFYGIATSAPDLAWYWTAGPAVVGVVALMGFALSRSLRVLAQVRTMLRIAEENAMEFETGDEAA